MPFHLKSSDSGEMAVEDSPDWPPPGWTEDVKVSKGRKIKVEIGRIELNFTHHFFYIDESL